MRAGHHCAGCGEPLPDGSFDCDACGGMSVFCSNDGCGLLVLESSLRCPACGAANEEYVPPAADPENAENAAVDELPPDDDYVSPLAAAARGYRPAAPAPPPEPAESPPDLEPYHASAGRADPPRGEMVERFVDTLVDAGRTRPTVPAAIARSSLWAGSDGAALVQVFARVTAPLQVGERGLIHLRLVGTGLPAAADVSVQISPSWQRSILRPRPFRLAAGGSYPLTPLKIVPSDPGSEAVVVELELAVNGRALQHCRGTWEVAVAAPRSASSGNDVGSMLRLFEELDRKDGRAPTGWEPVELVAEDLVGGDCKTAAPPRIAPAAPRELSTRGTRQDRSSFLVARPAGAAKGEPVARQLVIFGEQAAFGRGGDEEVTWWVRPEPFDADRWRRLSRRHLLVGIERGEAWACDASANGTLLNGQPMPRDEQRPLRNDDELDLAGVLPLRVELLRTAASDGVAAVLLHRRDGLTDRLGYCLSDGTIPVPLPDPAGRGETWVAIGADTDDGRTRLHIGEAADGGEPRWSAATGPAAPAARVLVRPLDQNAILSQTIEPADAARETDDE